LRLASLAIAAVLLGCSISPQGYLVEARSPALGSDGRLVENVGIETLGGVFTPILSVGCLAPCSTSQTFSTAEDNQTQIKIFVYRGKAQLVTQAHLLGKLEVTGFAPLPRGVPKIRVTFLTSDKGISLNAVDVSSGKELQIRRIDS
jgi:molecular chaperone DnaK (HSP70)